MKRVLVVCSVHRNTGLATAEQLSWLLERLMPDTLFLEHSPASHAAFLDNSSNSLEAAAVSLYRRVMPSVELVPVDIDLDVTTIAPQFDTLFDEIERKSERFCQLEFSRRQLTEYYGFAYLNGLDSYAIESEIASEMMRTVLAANSPPLSESLALWWSTHENREGAMIEHIEQYAANHAFRKAVLLVGSAHGLALRKRCQNPSSGRPSSVDWHFDWQDELFTSS